MFYKNQKYVIGVDGGGTKTIAVLTDLNGKILTQAKTGSSNILKTNIELAINNIVKTLNQVSQKYSKEKIVFIYIALAGGLERDEKKKKEIKKQLLEKQELSWVYSENFLIESDLKAAFRAGTEQNQGVLLIAGTGSIVVGWNKNKEAIVGGWDYLLGDQGSGFWIGQKALRQTCSYVDGLSPKALLDEVILKKLKIKTEADLMRKIYHSEAIKTIASVSFLVNLAAEKGDKTAKQILIEAANELAIRVNLIIQKLNFRDKKFPLILAGSVFRSKIVLTQVKKEIKKFAPQTDFILLKQKPVIGAIKLAIENYKNSLIKKTKTKTS